MREQIAEVIHDLDAKPLTALTELLTQARLTRRTAAPSAPPTLYARRKLTGHAHRPVEGGLS